MALRNGDGENLLKTARIASSHKSYHWIYSVGSDHLFKQFEVNNRGFFVDVFEEGINARPTICIQYYTIFTGIEYNWAVCLAG